MRLRSKLLLGGLVTLVLGLTLAWKAATIVGEAFEAEQKYHDIEDGENA